MKKFVTLTLALALLGSASFVQAATTATPTAPVTSEKREACQDNDKVIAKGKERPACVGGLGLGGALASTELATFGLAAAGFALVLGSGASTTTNLPANN